MFSQTIYIEKSTSSEFVIVERIKLKTNTIDDKYIIKYKSLNNNEDDEHYMDQDLFHLTHFQKIVDTDNLWQGLRCMRLFNGKYDVQAYMDGNLLCLVGSRDSDDSIASDMERCGWGYDNTDRSFFISIKHKDDLKAVRRSVSELVSTGERV